MATIDLGVRLNLENTSLRNIQEDLRRTVQSVNPQLNVNFNERTLRNRIESVTDDVRLQVRGIEGQPEIERALQRVLENRVVRLTGFDRRDLTRLRRQLEGELAQLEVDVPDLRNVQAQAARAGRAARGGGGAAAREQFQAASQVARELQGDINERRQRIVGILEEIVNLEERQRNFLEREAREAEQLQNRQLRAEQQQLSNSIAAEQRQRRSIVAQQNAAGQLEQTLLERVRQAEQAGAFDVGGSRIASAVRRFSDGLRRAGEAVGRQFSNTIGRFNAAGERAGASLERGDLAIRNLERQRRQQSRALADARARQTSLNASIESLNRAISASRVGRNFDRTAEISAERNRQLRLLSRANADAVRVAREQVAVEEQITQTRRRFARESARPQPVRVRQPGAGGRDITFRGAGDVARFGAQLNPQQFQNFIRVLRGVEGATTRAARGVRQFNSDIAAGTPLVERLRNRLSGGALAAFDFGTRVARAADRLLAWAAPSQLIFSTISRLQQAVTVITELDQQARRLVFFNRQSPISEARAQTETFAQTIDQSRANLEAFIRVANQTGLEARQISEAFVTASRVGVDLSGTIREINAGNSELSRGFASTVVGLVRLEAGALSAEQAVRRLRAIQAQFIDGLSDDQAFRQAAVANIGDLLAVEAARSSFNVDELSNAVARLGTSFNRIQGINIPATISIIGTAARVSGAEVGRLSTTFRQLTTLAVRNADQIREAFDVEIIDPETGQQSFEGLLNVLQEVNRLQQVDTGRATELLALLTDRRNINELGQLAQAAEELRQRFGDLSTEQAEVAIAGDAARENFLAQTNLSDSLQASFNRLDNAFTQLTQTFVTSDVFSGLVNGITTTVQSIDGLIQSISDIQPALVAIGTLAAGVVLPRIVAAAQGAGAALIDAFRGRSVRQSIQQTFRSAETSIQGINQARRAGLITSQQQRRIQGEIAAQTARQVGLETQLNRVKIQIGVEEARSVRNETRITTLKREQLSLERQLNGEIARGNLQRQNTASRITGGPQGLGQRLRQGLSGGRFAAIGAVGVTAGTLLAGTIGNELRSSGASREYAAGIEGGITGALAGGTLGAQIGTVITPGIGTAIGGILGTIGGGIAGNFISARSEAEKLNREQERAQGAERARLAAIDAQRAVIAARQARETREARNRSEAEREVLRIQQRIQVEQQGLNNIGDDLEARARAIESISRQQVRLEAAKGEVQRQQLEIQARQLAFAAQLNRIRNQEQEQLARIAVLQEAVIQNLPAEQVIPLRLEFNRAQTFAQLRTIRRQIEVELARQGTLELRTDTRAFEQSRLRVLNLQARERRLQLQQLQTEIQSRRQLQDRRARLVNEEIQRLNRANDSFARALGDAFERQLRVADVIQRAGNLAADALSRTVEGNLSELEARGVEVEGRLRAVQRASERQLALLQQNRAVAEQALGTTGVSAFQGTEDLEAALTNAGQQIRRAGAAASSQIFDQARATFNVDVFVQRERARLTRLEFNQRLQQTRTELQFRQRIIEAETQLLQRRIQAERELRDLRVDQQREFGRLLLQGPEEFNRAVQGISTATNFFRDVRGLDVNNLQRIADRAVQLRAQGRFDILQSVQRGLNTLISTGGARVVGAATNAELLRVFEQVVTAGLPGGTSPEEVALQLERQREEAARQTAEQEQIRRRQEELQAIAVRQAQLQEAEARLAAENVVVAARQRDQLIASAQRRFNELNEIKRILLNIQTRGIAVGAGAGVPAGAPTAGPAAVPTGPAARAAGAPIGRAAARELLPAINSLPPNIRAAVTRALGDQIRAATAQQRTSILDETTIADIARLNAIQLQRELEAIQQRGGGAEEQERARVRAAARLDLIRRADPSDTRFQAAIENLNRSIEQATGQGRDPGQIGLALDEFQALIRGFSAAEQQAFRLAESQRALEARTRFNQDRAELAARTERRRIAITNRRERELNELRQQQRVELRRSADTIREQREALGISNQARAFGARVQGGGRASSLITQPEFRQLRAAIISQREGGARGTDVDIARRLANARIIQPAQRTQAEEAIRERFNLRQAGIIARTNQELQRLEQSAARAQQELRDNTGVRRFRTASRAVESAFGLLEAQVRRNAEQEQRRFQQGQRFNLLSPGLRPANIPRGDQLPGLRENASFNRIIQEFSESLRLDRRQGFQLVPRELTQLRQAIATQEGGATPRQERRLRELERQVQTLGFGTAQRRATRGSFFDPAQDATRALLGDRRARAGVELGFRELLQGNTDFVRQLRDLTQTTDRNRVRFGSREEREINVRQFTDLLRDVGLGGVAEGITSQRDAARLTNQLLRLSQTLQRNQGTLNRSQVRQIADIFSQEIRRTLVDVNAETVRRARGQGARESDEDFLDRTQNQSAEEASRIFGRNFEAAATQALSTVGQGAFREAAEQVASQVANRVAEGNVNATRQITEALEKLNEIEVKFQDRVNVEVEATVNNNLRVDRAFTDELRRIFPNVSDTQLQNLLKTVAAMVKVERRRGTRLPEGADGLLGETE